MGRFVDIATCRVSLLCFVLGSLSGCGATVDPNAPVHAGVRGYPAIVAAVATFEDEDGGTCLSLEGARVVVGSDPTEPKDLSVFRHKTLLLVPSRQQAISLASLADADLETQAIVAGKPQSHPYALAAGDYGLVSISADGQLSSVATRAIDSLRLRKSVANMPR